MRTYKEERPEKIFNVLAIEMDRRTGAGDSVILKVKKNANLKPSLALEFFSMRPEFRGLNGEIDVSAYLPEKPYVEITDIDPISKRPICIEKKGPKDWTEYVKQLKFQMGSIARNAGRSFSTEEV